MKKPLLVIGNKNYSSWSLRGWLVVKESGIDFDELSIPLFTDGGREKIRRYNPTGKVPVLMDEGVPVWDSLAIAEHLAERVPTLWPRDVTARTRARCIVAEMHSGFPALREQMPMNCRARDRRVPLTEALSADIARVRQIWETTRAEYGGEEGFLFGPFTIADAFFAPVVCRFVTFGVDCPGEAGRYMQAVLARPSMKEWLAAAETETEIIERYEIGR